MYPSISLYLILYYPLIPVKLGACGLLLYASSCSISSVKNVSTAVAVSLSTSVIVRSNHVPSGRSTVATIAQLVTLYFLVMLYPFIVVPCPGTWRRTSVYSYRGSALMASFFIEAYTLTNRPLSSYYAGLSFKSGYQQTGYHHHILSYYDVKYYYCLLLGAWSLVNLLSEVWFLEALQPHSFISVSAYNLSADQPAT